MAMRMTQKVHFSLYQVFTNAFDFCGYHYDWTIHRCYYTLTLRDGEIRGEADTSRWGSETLTPTKSHSVKKATRATYATYNCRVIYCSRSRDQ